MIPQNNNKPPNNRIRERPTRFNDFLSTNLDATLNDRYCRACHVRLVNNPRNSPHDKYIYSCPSCNCTTNIHHTEPAEKIVTTFPTHNALSVNNINKKLVVQSDDQRLSRSKYFIQKRLEEKQKEEGIEDPYLAIIKSNNKITITNLDYNDPTTTTTEYDDER